ncbi:MAG TPA: DUF6624 domain-containing protein [Steroidobacteraceae bacterium]|nr:DUF6624 domain-containing protein [Steroidobacteraceae bacterium]
MIIFVAFAAWASPAKDAAALPDPAKLAEQVTAGRVTLETFDFAGAGYWQLAQADRFAWWQGASTALRLGQPGMGDACSPETQRQGASIAWLLLLLQAPDADEWSKAAQAMRKQLTTLDATLAAAAPAPNPNADPRVTELLARYSRDQAVRGVFTEKKWTEGMPPLAVNNWSPAFISRMTAIDCSNTAWLKAQLEQIHWFDIPTFGAEADTAAWHLVQHADREPDFQRHMLKELEALPLGKTDRKRVGYLWDRVAIADKRLQRYGTQGQCTDKAWKPFDVEDPGQLDERRAKLGMEPIAEHALVVWREACPK